MTEDPIFRTTAVSHDDFAVVVNSEGNYEVVMYDGGNDEEWFAELSPEQFRELVIAGGTHLQNRSESA